MPYLAFAAGCGWGEAAKLHCRHEPPHPSAGRVVSETRFVTTRDSGPSAVLQADPTGCPLTETLKCVIKA